MQAPIPIGTLRDYIAFARNNCHPELSPEAATDIVDGYMNMRRMGSSRKVPPLPAVLFACLPTHPSFHAQHLSHVWFTSSSSV